MRVSVAAERCKHVDFLLEPLSIRTRRQAFHSKDVIIYVLGTLLAQWYRKNAYMLTGVTHLRSVEVMIRGVYSYLEDITEAPIDHVRG